MSYKTIVAVLQDEDDARRVLDVAVALASRAQAHLVGVHAEPLPVPVASPMGFPDAAMMGASEDMSRERAQKLEKLFSDRMSREAVASEWRSMFSFSGDSALSALESARCGDIVIAGQVDPDKGASGSPDIETLIQGAGRPVLVVPWRGKASTEAKRIVLAWNGSRQAARAAFDALDFIRQAEQTTVLTINPVENPGEQGPLPGTEIAATLARQGANVVVDSRRSGEASVAETIASVVAEKNADLLVLGAFSHSRLKEMFFGGTTRSTIENPPCLTLFAR
ncbi:universal stress protein [Nitratireductor mangrovi]|uniref:Universal stress protein n=1 Tax=Nitratireductor mangrovi TaxID=2599600 RepID=A0A5B8KVK3_9HYPH|nr:universal stress protein [Nitratireductor mangrovi]QDY99673.1 universal stress protein [Nitratireductor mangrovi]